MSTESGWWWLSFADADLPEGTQFLGVAIVQGKDMIEAIKKSHRLKINPGGEVLGAPVINCKPPKELRNRLLAKEEALSVCVEDWEAL